MRTDPSYDVENNIKRIGHNPEQDMLSNTRCFPDIIGIKYVVLYIARIVLLLNTWKKSFT